MKRVIYQLIVAMALVGFVNAVWPFDSKKGKKDKKKSKRDKKERQMFDGEGEVMTKQEMQMIIKENEIDDVGETPFMAYMIQDEDGDGVNDVTGQKLNVNQIMN